MHHFRFSAAVGFALLLTLAAFAAEPASREQAEALKRKITLISRRGEASVRPVTPARTTVTEGEVNGYLAHEVADDLPAGVVSPRVTLLASGRVSGHAVVDLDRVRAAAGTTSVLNPIRFLRGRLPVTGTGMLRSANGRAHFQFESANVSGIPIPKLLLQQIVTYYSRSERFPSGVSLDEPFALPAGIREIHFEQGKATVIQ